MRAPEPAFTAEPGGVRLAVRLTPRASRDAFAGLAADADGRQVLLIRLSAPPVEGAANRALVAFLADALGLRKADVMIRAGETSRQKLLHVQGDASAILARLSALAAG